MPSSKFSIPGFIRLAPAVYLQDSQVSSSSSFTNWHYQNPQTYFQSTNPSFSSTAFTLHPNGTASNTVPTSKSDDVPPPEIIIIASWTGAAARHVEKYTSTYNTIFPGVPILLLTTVVSDLALHSTTHKINSLIPAVNYLLTRQIPPKSQPPQSGQPFYSSSTLYNHIPNLGPFNSILLHAFSEGGSYTTVALATLYLSSSSLKIPISALILDSTPGHKPSQTRARSAFAKSLPQSFPVPRFIPYLAVSVSTLTLKLLNRYAEGKNLFDTTRAALNDSALFELQGVPRLYLFSEKDDIVLWEEIESHAKQSGIRSLCVKFKGTEHCGHIRGARESEKGKGESKIYWAAVRGVWEMRGDGGLGIKLRGIETACGDGVRSRRLSLDSLCCGGLGW